MKKLFAIIVAMAMLLSVAAFADAADVVGTWNLTEIVYNGASLSPSDLGASMSMTLNEDGSALVVSSMEEQGEMTGSWTIDGTTVSVTVDGSTSDFEYADGKLVSELPEQNMSMVFTQGEASEAYTPAAGNAGAALEDFAGKWTAVKVGMGGTYFPYDMLNQSLGGDMDPLTVEIEGSSIKLAGFMFGDSLPGLPANFADGVLSYELDTGSTQISISAQMLEDGTMSMALSANGSSFDMIMEKTA